MNFTLFDPNKYRKEFSEVISELVVALKASEDEGDQQVLQMIDAMQQSIDIMERVDADEESSNVQPLNTEDVTQIADYALALLDEISSVAANRGMQSAMLQLHRLSIPVVLWVHRHSGKINKLDIIVNAVATYANELTQAEQLEQLCMVVSKAVHCTADEIKQDLEATNPMRPWRILNLNWGIVATRSHNTGLMEQVFEQLIKNISADAKGFFQEGMQQMDIVGYPDHVREVMEKYNKLVGNSAALH